MVQAGQCVRTSRISAAVATGGLVANVAGASRLNVDAAPGRLVDLVRECVAALSRIGKVKKAKS